MERPLRSINPLLDKEPTDKNPDGGRAIDRDLGHTFRMAENVALTIGFPCINAESVGIALLRDGHVNMALQAVGVDPVRVQEEYMRISDYRGEAWRQEGELYFTPRVTHAISLALKKVEQGGHTTIKTTDMLHAFLEDQGDITSVVLQYAGANVEAVRAKLDEVRDQEVDWTHYKPLPEVVLPLSKTIELIAHQLQSVTWTKGTPDEIKQKIQEKMIALEAEIADDLKKTEKIAGLQSQ
jgi:ATP-dependent Clp protease ATP-binding subunit ClpA